jgi:hypothetical protein
LEKDVDIVSEQLSDWLSVWGAVLSAAVHATATRRAQVP